MHINKNFFKVVGLTFSIILFGCSDKEDEKALQAAAEQAGANLRANAQKRQKAALKANAVKLADVVELYRRALDGLSTFGNQAVIGVNKMMEGTAYKEARAEAPARADEVVVRNASLAYDGFQKLVRNYKEQLDDQGVNKKFAEVKAFVRALDNGREKDLFIAGITSCENAEGWLAKYRVRHRSELGEQIKQMKECSEQLRPTLLELDAVLTSLAPWINDK